tara:strand:- start:3790 stop:4383 length:594 start_codon:yes stop_codon:yes gene_type:complete
MSEYKEDFSNHFQIYLNSADATTGAATPANMKFDIGSVLSQAPNIQNFQDCAYCKITLAYICIEQTTAHFQGVATSTLKVKLGNLTYPNNIETQTLTARDYTGANRIAQVNSNFKTSDVIGVVPVGNTNVVYCNNDYDNSPVVIQNPFSGSLNVLITDQDDLAPFTLDGTTPVNMLLKVEFPQKTDPRFIKNISTII